MSKECDLSSPEQFAETVSTIVKQPGRTANFVRIGGRFYISETQFEKHVNIKQNHATQEVTPDDSGQITLYYDGNDQLTQVNIHGHSTDYGYSGDEARDRTGVILSNIRKFGFDIVVLDQEYKPRILHSE